MAVEFRLLGAVELYVDGRAVDIGHARQRCVLAVLLVEANRPVTIDQLADRVWGNRLPQGAHRPLYGYISRLRHALACTEAAIVRQSGGYVLTVDPLTVDLHRFHDLVRQARAADDEPNAAALLQQGLDLWRGEPFATLDNPWLSIVRETLEGQRLTAELDRNELAFNRGQHAELLDELWTRAAAHPLDERVVGQFMLALYRCGRQADALARYQQLRLRLADELGTDPSPPLLQLHQRILTADQTLLMPTVGPAAQPAQSIARSTDENVIGGAAAAPYGPVRPRWPIIAVVAVVAMLGGAIVFELVGGALRRTPEENVFNEFDLEMPTRTAYDLDVPRGQRPQGRALGSESGLDLYRTSSGVNNGGQISGVSTTSDNSKNFNAIHQINPDDPPEACRRLPVQGGGNIALRDLRQGAKVCLRTHDHRWTVFTVTRMPSHAEDLLVVHVTVLNG